METPESIEAMGRAVDKLITDVHLLKNSNPTLRDQFAMAALNGLCSLNWRTKDIAEPTAKDHAEQSYKYADAMMKARKQN